MKIEKINESYTKIITTPQQVQQIFEYLKCEVPGARFDKMVQWGRKSMYEYFAILNKDNPNEIFVLNGHLSLLSQFGIQSEIKEPEFTEEFIGLQLKEIINKLPFSPYDYQLKAAKESIIKMNGLQLLCTGSGKSLTIAIIAEFFRQQNKKGILLVPNINLLTQIKADFEDYKLFDLVENTHIIGGGNTDKHFDKSLTISTWQSLNNYREDLDKIDFLITDETHRYASSVTSEIVKGTTNCKYKLGFTGTLPESPVQKMMLFGLFGLSKKYIGTAELIERGLATPLKINSIILDHKEEDKRLINNSKVYNTQLKILKECEKRNEFIIDLTCKISKTGNTLVLYSHTEHGKSLFIDTMKKLYPNICVENKDITGKNSFEFQEQYGVYFLNGEDDSKTRERTRKILEEHKDAILIANYALLSTGVNIKRLHNMILASPLKAFTTVTQSIGRLVRLHPEKERALVFDIVDNTGLRGRSGPFWKQYQHRLTTSYHPEEFPVSEIQYNLY